VIHTRAKVFFLLYLCAIVYLSLYPWEFALHAKATRLFWAPIVGRRQVLDTVLNVFFYIPLGAAGYLSVRRGRSGWLLAVLAGGLLSWMIEWLQLWSPTRYANLTDLASNTAGTMLGASAAYGAIRGKWFAENLAGTGFASRWHLHSRATLFLTAWILWQMFPFIPAISLPRLMGLFTLLAPWSWRTLVEAFLGFLALRFSLGRSPWLWVAFLALFAQAFLLDRSLSLSAVTGAGLAWGGGGLVRGNGLLWLEVLLPGWLIFEELRPFTFVQEPRRFGWAPFESWYEVSAGPYYPVIFGKLFLYLSLIWVLKERRGWRWAIAIPAVVLACGEWMQRYIPGRTPESTDLVLLLAAAVLLALCAKRAGRV
jgi:VanZ family protein